VGTMEEFTVKIPPGDSSEIFTGERYIPSISGEIAWEHLHRYAAAVQVCGGKRVLDIASGEGYGSFMLSQVATDVVGVDIDELTVSRASVRYQRDNLSFKVGKCESIPCESSSFDVVVSFETVEHVADPEAFLVEVLRVLRPDGYLIISSPERETYNAGRSEHNKFHLSEMSETEIFAALARRFRHVAISRQSIVVGSVLLPSERGEQSPCVFQRTDGELRSSHTLRTSPYIVALCSNSETSPVLRASLFDSGLSALTLSALEGGIAERDAKIRQLIDQQADFVRHIAALQGGIDERDAKICELLRQDELSREKIGALQGGIEERDVKIAELCRKTKAR
jgi:SAM-dependent methyltransferase